MLGEGPTATVSDLAIDIEVACAAARRYAQLVHYHDHQTRPQYGHHPFVAWRAYCHQFVGIPRAATILSLIGHSFVMEMRRLVGERKEYHVQGKSPASAKAGKWHQL